MFRFLSMLPFLLLSPDDGGAGGGPGAESDDPEAGGTEGEPNEGDDQGKTGEDLESLKAELEALKKQSSGKDKTVTKLQKQLDDMKKAQMTEEERKAAEEAERQEKAQEEHNRFLTDCRVIAAERAGLSEEEASLIAGSTQDEIRENGKRFQALLKTQFDAGYEKAKKETMNGGVPKGGDDPKTGTSKKLSNLFK